MNTSTNKQCTSSECPDCGSNDSLIRNQQQTFQHGTGHDAVKLTCDVPVHKCGHCGYEWTTSDAEDIRHAAVCHHFGRLTPEEILHIRESCNLSQAEFSRITGFGEASLSRWETGAQMQNASSDRLLRLLLADPKNLQRVQEFANILVSG